ncbi:porin [Herbaspirillum rubrisubalbicans]|uniref:Porin n=1 Tax=Herbaspirillum rubrisubalbicans TaxID=80842 RepID=A0AAD0UBM2_9BURK|nr:porin [Herbaspirillum rubrisubalbicans]ALU89530.1 outer membrane protein (porin) signal peptide protein [Herbaspirillum rubrisubalbicans M1]AYR24610.1 porin [Herbaspirillum rubrisubalbicans]
MKKYRRQSAAIAALALWPAATWAQSSVSISGIMDGGVSYVSNQAGSSNLRADNGIGAPNILFIKGQEDLGGGTAAIFQLESQFNLSTGASLPGNNLIFGRQSLVGLKDKQWGTLTAGNQYEFMHDSLLFGGFDSALTYGGYYTFRQGPFSALAIPNNPTGASDFDRVAGSSRVANSVKYLSPDVSGVTFGGMYGFGEVAGDTASSRTVSLGANYAEGPFGLGVAYTDARYSSMNSGHDGIRNWGLGARYQIGDYKLNLLYTNTRNTQTAGQVNVYQAGVNWQMAVAWNLGLSYEYMQGNAQLANNYAHQGSATLQYWLSKRTDVYLQTVYQKAGGDNTNTQAWINGLYGPKAMSSSSSQAIFRVGLVTRF